MRKIKKITVGSEKVAVRELTVAEADGVFTTIEKGYKVSALDILMSEQNLPSFVIDLAIDRDVGELVAEQELAPSEVVAVYEAVKEVNNFLSSSLVMLAQSNQARTLYQAMTGGSEGPQ